MYGCQRHMVDLPVKPVEEMELNEMHMMGEEDMPSVDKPLRAGEYVVCTKNVFIIQPFIIIS